MASRPQRLGVVVGMRAEALLARRLTRAEHVAISGATPDGAQRAVARLLAGGCDALLSFGLAGGLDPQLRPGAIIVPDCVKTSDQQWQTSPALSAWLAHGLGAGTASLWHSDRAITTARAKQELFHKSGCGAVDMESGAVARAAHEAGCGFAVLRCVCDSARRSLPLAVEEALRPDGSVALGSIMRGLARQPSQIKALLGLSIETGFSYISLYKHIKKLPEFYT